MTTTTFLDRQTVIEADWLNDVNTVAYSQGVVIASAGQTVFNIPFTCSLGLPLHISIDGVVQIYNSSYTRASLTQITFTEGLHVGALVEFRG